MDFVELPQAFVSGFSNGVYAMRFGLCCLVLSLAIVPAFAESGPEPFRHSNAKTVIDLSDLTRSLEGLPRNDALIANLDVKSALDPRIFGGEPADIKDTPYQVALVFGKYKDPFRAQFCGGSIIGDQWILTAAHCVFGSPINVMAANVDVIANTTFFATGGDRIPVEKIILSDRYDPSTHDYDIALMKLASHAAMLKPIALPGSDDTLPDGTNLLVTGWGAQREGGTGSAYLIGANIPSVSNRTCNAPDSYNDAITPRMICAGLRDGGLDSCQGDSGGPAAAVENGRPILMGIVSFGEGCARRLKYGVYTDVRSFSTWISENTR